MSVKNSEMPAFAGMTTEGPGRLAGIARHVLPKAAMEVLARAEVTVDGGLTGDYRGLVKQGGRGRRQVTLIEADAWALATAMVGVDIPWYERRANLLVERLRLPRTPGALISVGAVVLEVTRECDPCVRMDALAPGLEAALRPDWRGGICTRVRVGGVTAVGDTIRIEES